ncbi:MAG: hypothetical protein AB1813_06395 [Verrucomicrobiota bacterium]
MFDRLKKFLLGTARDRTPMADSERLLILQRELASLRLDLAEKEKCLADFRRQSEAEKLSADIRWSEQWQSHIAQLLEEAATPVAQLLTQTHLHNNGTPVQTKDVLALVHRLIALFERLGLKAEGEIGAIVAFDPDRHEMMEGQAEVGRGSSVVVRMCGVVHGKKILRKALCQAV